MATKHQPDGQPRRNEDEYFTRQDAELVKSMRVKLDQERAQTERKQHYMKCPKCGADLKEVTQGDVKIDRCPECHGVWLDSGEIDLIKHVSKGGAEQFMEGLLSFFKSGHK